MTDQDRWRPRGRRADPPGLTNFGLAPHYRPHDIYVGTLVTALQALHGGVTTVVDNSGDRAGHGGNQAAPAVS